MNATAHTGSEAVPRPAHPATAARERLMALDVFRGATIAAMLLVNNPGSWTTTYSPLLHAPWHGWTFTDTVFPFFLWIVGVAIPLSVARRLAQGQSRAELVRHSLRRAFILFGLGLFLNSFSYFIDGSLFRDGFAEWLRHYTTTVRIPGVLQRIAVCYFVAVVLFLFCRLRDQILCLLSFLLGYWLLMAFVPVPGHGAGGFARESNLAQFIDNLVLNGPVIGTHVWKTAATWDPEGILSTLPAIATCLFGVMAGQLLNSAQTRENQTAWLFASGNLLMLAGLLMDPFLPINKNLWTSSYSVFMAGLASNVFAVSYWLIDVQGWRTWAKPFAIYGMNAITVFVLSGIIGRLLLEIKVRSARGELVPLKSWLYDTLFAPLGNSLLGRPENASLLWALLHVALLYLVAFFMYRRRWVVKF